MEKILVHKKSWGSGIGRSDLLAFWCKKYPRLGWICRLCWICRVGSWVPSSIVITRWKSYRFLLVFIHCDKNYEEKIISQIIYNLLCYRIYTSIYLLRQNKRSEPTQIIKTTMYLQDYLFVFRHRFRICRPVIFAVIVQYCRRGFSENLDVVQLSSKNQL